MEKHEYNIFPDMTEDKYKMLLSDLSDNGYDSSFPIYLYQNKILDGWNRWRACNELNINPEYVEFEGTDIEAIRFVLRTNKRRDLSSSQWATISAEADEITKIIKEDIEKQRREKISFNNGMKATPQQIAGSQERESDEVIADMFHTNKQYVRDARRLKTENPVAFEQVKSGEKTLTKIKQEEKKQNEETNSHLKKDVNFIEELVSEMYGTINKYFSKLKNNEKEKAIELLIQKLKESQNG